MYSSPLAPLLCWHKEGVNVFVIQSGSPSLRSREGDKGGEYMRSPGLFLIYLPQQQIRKVLSGL